MAEEIEVKVPLDDPTDLRSRLRVGGARRTGYVLETNRILDAADRGLLAEDRGLRLRTSRCLEGGEQLRATIAFKGPRAAGVLKARDELETAVADPAVIAAILERLGYREVVVYEKRRETWQIERCEVSIDELPRLGWFVEIEGPNPGSITQACRRTGIDPQAALRETYVEMAAREGEPAADGVRRLLFGPFPPVAPA
jgi:adenylate cyclase class 2